jgi:hypothetical protein
MDFKAWVGLWLFPWTIENCAKKVFKQRHKEIRTTEHFVVQHQTGQFLSCKRKNHHHILGYQGSGLLGCRKQQNPKAESTVRYISPRPCTSAADPATVQTATLQYYSKPRNTIVRQPITVAALDPCRLGGACSTLVTKSKVHFW